MAMALVFLASFVWTLSNVSEGDAAWAAAHGAVCGAALMTIVVTIVDRRRT